MSKKRSSLLREEIKQTRPFRSVYHEGVLSLLRSADLIRRHFEGCFQESGITLQQYNVLRILRGAHPSGLPTLEIASRMVEREPGITRLIDRLEEKGLVMRVPCERDRRRVWCRLTAPGMKVVDRLDDPVQLAEATALGSLSKKEVGELIALLEKSRRPRSSAEGRGGSSVESM